VLSIPSRHMYSHTVLQVSLMAASMKLSDPCTFRLLIKNVTLLLPDRHPLRLEAYATLDTLVQVYGRLDSALLQAGEVDSETLPQVAPLLDKAIGLQRHLKECLVACIALPA
jgi:hypothetical protein